MRDCLGYVDGVFGSADPRIGVWTEETFDLILQCQIWLDFVCIKDGYVSDIAAGLLSSLREKANKKGMYLSNTEIDAETLVKNLRKRDDPDLERFYMEIWIINVRVCVW